MSDKNNNEVKGITDSGLNIRIKDYGDKSGVKIDIYDKDPKEEDHKSVHIKIDYDKEKFESNSNATGENQSGSGNCYLTSACMSHFKNNFDDKCEELEILRWFRDKFVSKEEIEHYYEIAPMIVSEIDSSENKNNIYSYIYNNIVFPSVNAIKQGNYKFAYDRYKNSVISLEESFVRNLLIKRLVRAIKK